MTELGVSGLLGEDLNQEIRSTFERNEITPSAAADEIAPLAERAAALDSALNSLITSFEFFGIGAEQLPPGEFEVGFLVPRPEVGDDLAGLGEEFIELKRILNPFLELTTGSRPDVRVRSIASSEFQVLLDSLPATALLLATALERLISSYEKVINIRLARQQLRESGASKETLEAVSRDAEEKMGRDIEALVEELLQEAATRDEARHNELRTELRHALNALANRIDRGYSVEVRAGELPEEEESGEDDEAEEPSPEDQLLRNQTERVLAAQKRLSFRNVSGEPILQLPEGEPPADNPP